MKIEGRIGKMFGSCRLAAAVKAEYQPGQYRIVVGLSG